jgi:hypothetical protein
MEKSKNKVSGILNFNQTVIDNGPKLGSGLEGLLPNISLSPGSVPTGPANAYMKNASFEFSQVDYKITKVQFSDSDKSRFSIPDSLVNSRSDSHNMSLNSAGFKMFYHPEPFGFEFRSTRQPNVVNVHTNSSDFLMTDKFM